MDNRKIAQILQEVGDILEIRGENPFRVNAYHNAAISVLNFPKDLRDVVDENPKLLEKIPGIGENLRQHIEELVSTGACREFEKIQKSIPHGLLEMLRIRGVGPKKVKLFYSQLKIKDLKGLERAAKDGILATLPGMGEKSQQDILEGMKEHSKFELERVLISEALMEAEKYIKYMQKCKEIKRIEYAGSLRRRQETIGDIDLLATVGSGVGGTGAGEIMQHFVKYKEVVKVLASGETKSAVILESGIQVDLRVVDDNVFGAALHYFTGSKNHNILIRDMAKKKGLKISEYGVFKIQKGKSRAKGEGKLIACKTEKDVFNAVGLPYIVPELRKGEDELQYALMQQKAHKEMPKLIELGDLKGDLHTHSNWSDGRSSIEEMAKAYKTAGYKYMAMCDHSSVKDIREQWKEIDKINKEMKDFKILKGSEVDILKDGTLDFKDDILKQLNVVVIAAHMYGRLPENQQMKRLIAAIENPYSKILAHPSGRMINRRGPMEIDMVKIIDACKVNNVVIEINSNPLRLDLTDRYVRIAKDKGVKISINTDAHDASQCELLKYGIFVARRGWLTKNDVINTYDLDKLLKFWE